MGFEGGLGICGTRVSGLGGSGLWSLGFGVFVWRLSGQGLGVWKLGEQIQVWELEFGLMAWVWILNFRFTVGVYAGVFVGER